MKIVMFGHKRIPSREGGVEVVVEELCTRMAALGHEVVCYNRGGHHVCGREFEVRAGREYKGIRMRTMPTLDGKGLAAVTSAFFGALCSAFGNGDVVHIHGEGPAFFSWIPKLSGKKVVVTVHGLDWQREKWSHGFGGRFIRWGERAAVRFADEIIVLSRNAESYFRNTYGRKTVLIPNGVAKPETAAAEWITEQLKLQADGYILFLGRLVPEKRVHDLIRAFKEVDTDKKLVIAGGTSDTEEYGERLKKLASGDERIRFTGFVQGKLLEELYTNAYLYVLPSQTEGMPLSLLEAMSYGNCCLVSDIPECVEVVGRFGATFPTGNVEKLKEALQFLCDRPDAVGNYKKGAREYICSRYPWENVVQKTLELYK